MSSDRLLEIADGAVVLRVELRLEQVDGFLRPGEQAFARDGVDRLSRIRWRRALDVRDGDEGVLVDRLRQRPGLAQRQVRVGFDEGVHRLRNVGARIVERVQLAGKGLDALLAQVARHAHRITSLTRFGC